MYDTDSVPAEGGAAAARLTLQPRTRLRIVRAPRSDYVLEQTFSGEPLPVPPPGDILVPPEQWPEADAFCAVAWDAIEAHYAPAT